MSQSDLITFYNFPITSANLLRVIDQFGDAGRELLTNEPWPGAVLETNPIYAKTSDLTTLSPEGRAKFNDDYSSKRNTEYRKQIKAFGLRFIIQVDARAGKFNFIPMLVSLGSGIGLLGKLLFFL